MFFDEDQVIVGDVHELVELVGDHDVLVMRQQEQFEWASVMVFNNSKLRRLTPEYIQNGGNKLFDLAWANDVGDLPKEWNHAVGMGVPRTDVKLYHYTQGIPYWPECEGLPEDEFWFREHQEMLKSVDWIDLHRNTRHFGPVMERYLKKYGIAANFTRRQ